MPTRITSALGATASSAVGLGIKGVKSAQGAGLSTMGAYSALSTVNSETKQGRSVGAAALKAGASYAGYVIAPELMYAKTAIDLSTKGTVAAINFRRRRGHEIAGENRYATVGRGFADTGQAQTMRQAATQQIQANKMNARSALGGEARIFSNKNYNQHTRPYL